MKKITALLLIATLFRTTALSAQAIEENYEEESPPPSIERPLDFETKNWIYGVGALVAAAVGIIAVLISPGASAPPIVE